MAVTGESIRRFVSEKTIAVVGASATGKGFGSYAYAELKKRGYRVMAVHPTRAGGHSQVCLSRSSARW
jgi:predicted CoA-binding protein